MVDAAMVQASAIDAYDFVAPQRIVFGWGRWREVGSAVAALGRRAFLVFGSRTLAARGFAAELADVLRSNHIDVVELSSIAREPEPADVDEATARLRAAGAGAGDVVIGVGGGSAIDLAKAAAALATNTAGSSVLNYLEGVGRGLSISSAPLPVIAMPTTAGTGSEATKNAVISSYDPPFKKSLRSDLMMPRLVVVDPQLTTSMPREVTAWTGMDAITQLIESYISRKARPIAQALAAGGLRSALGAICEAADQPDSRRAREAMSHAALVSGMALANSGLGMAHGVAAALGSRYRVPHGLACAVLLPVALRVNRDVARERLDGLARAVDLAGADQLVGRIDQIAAHLEVPRRLSALGVNAEGIAGLTRDSRGNSMDGNPRALADDELAGILEAML
jgi:alcohol dehydrogenase class IV